MRKSKLVYKALLLSAASRPSTSLLPPPCCGCSTTRRRGSENSVVSQVVNPLARQSWLGTYSKVLRGRDFRAQQLERWNHWPPSAIIGLFLGVSALPLLAHNEEDPKDKVDTNDESGGVEEEKLDMEKVLLQVQKGVDQRLEALKSRASSLPTYNISAKGQQVSVRFTVSPSCDLSHLIVDMVNRLGGKSAGRGGGSEMIVQASDSTVARQLIITASEYSVPRDDPSLTSRQFSFLEDKQACQSSKLCILMFEPLIGDLKAIEVEFLKKGFLTANELDAIISSLRIAGGVDRDLGTDKGKSRKRESVSGTETSSESLGELDRQGEPLDGWSQSSRWKYRSGLGEAPKERSTSGQNRFAGRGKMKVLEALESMGVKVYGVSSIADVADVEKVTWDSLAGYHEQKRLVTVSMLRFPAILFLIFVRSQQPV